MKLVSRNFIMACSLMMYNNFIYAQTPTKSAAAKILELAYENILLVISAMVLTGVLFAGINLIWALIAAQKIKLLHQFGPEVLEKSGLTQKTSLWSSIYNKLSGLKPLEEEKDIEMHHHYDGIRELDNSLPPWWLYLFYITIAWGIGYFAYYHMSDMGTNQEQEYVQAIEEAEIQKAAFLASQADVVDEKNVVYLEDPTALTEGKEIFLANCAVCHGQQGEGGVGPNFTDKYWLHGGSINEIFTVIKYGVPAKGMVAWNNQLRPGVIQKVSSFIWSLQGTNPPNQKEPQGTLYEPAAKDTTEVSQ